MSVPNQTPYNIYTANGLTTVFAYEFYLISAGDIQVTINGAVITGGYSVGGVGNVGGGDITFLTPPANGAMVMLERNIPTYRLTDYQDNGDLLADTVNKDFDRLWMAIQRAFIYLGLALTRPLLGGPFNAKGYRIENLGYPVFPQDAATKSYVDNSIIDNTNAWKDGDRALNQKIDANFRRTVRVPESFVDEVYPVSGRRNSLFGWNSAGRPVPVFSMTETADLALKLASNDVALGAALIGLYPRGTVQSAITWVTPDGFSSLEECFSCGIETVVIPAGIYTLTKKMRVNISHNLNIICQPGAVFRLADNVRDNMLVFVGNLSNDFSWSGGEIDGNFDGQGGEQLSPGGTVLDVSHGLIISNFRKAEINDIYAHDCMGHHINHGGNIYFKARKIRVKAHISVNHPVGGGRGDGITGTSRYIDIDGVEGYTSDDMVGIFSGISWIEGIGSVRDIQSVRVRNIRGDYVVDADGSTKRYTWHGVTVTSTNGVRVEKIDIDGVQGEFQDGGVRVPCNVGIGDEYSRVSIGSAIVNNVNVYINGVPGDGFTSSKAKCAIYVGFHNPETSPLAGEYFDFDSLTLSNISQRNSGNTFSSINIGHASLKNIIIDGVNIFHQSESHSLNAVYLCGNRDINAVKVNNTTHNNTDDTPGSVVRNRRVVYCELGSSKTTSFYCNGLTGRRGVGNFLIAANYANNINLYGYDIILEAPKGFSSAKNTRGVYFTDRYIGRVKASSKSGGWEFEDWYTTWNSADFGRPSADNFPGYADITAWGEGTVIRVIGSPYHECTGWICRSSTPTWQLLSPQFTDVYGDVKPSWTPVGCTPGVEISTFIPFGSTDPWPVTGGGFVRTNVSTSGTGSGTIQEFTPSSLTAIYTRVYQSGGWSAWKQH